MTFDWLFCPFEKEKKKAGPAPRVTTAGGASAPAFG
jgi:hypothetical protein